MCSMKNIYIYMEVSINGGTPKSSILEGIFHFKPSSWEYPCTVCSSIQDGPPSYVCWFINPMKKTRVIYIYYKP